MKFGCKEHSKIYHICVVKDDPIIYSGAYYDFSECGFYVLIYPHLGREIPNRICKHCKRAYAKKYGKDALFLEMI